MSVPGYRNDIVAVGPLSPDDYFILTSRWYSSYEVADTQSIPNFEASVNNVFTLGLVVKQLQPVGDISRGENPQVIFSAPLTTQAIELGAFDSSVIPLYLKYQDYTVSSNSGLVVMTMSLLAYDSRDYRFLGYLNTYMNELSSTPKKVIFYPKALPNDQFFSAGLPLVGSVGVNYATCTDSYLGYCNPTDNIYQSFPDNTYVSPYIVALPLTSYQNGSCNNARTPRPGELPDSLAYQQCVVAREGSSYAKSSICQNLPHFYKITLTELMLLQNSITLTTLQVVGVRQLTYPSIVLVLSILKKLFEHLPHTDLVRVTKSVVTIIALGLSLVGCPETSHPLNRPMNRQTSHPMNRPLNRQTSHPMNRPMMVEVEVTTRKKRRTTG